MDLAHNFNLINVNKESPSSFENFAAVIDTYHTEFIICHFENNVTYLITQFGKIGNLYSVQVDNTTTNDPVFTLRALLGGDNIELEAGIRFIVEQLNLKKPLLFSLTLKDYSVSHLKLIVEAIRNH